MNGNRVRIVRRARIAAVSVALFTLVGVVVVEQMVRQVSYFDGCNGNWKSFGSGGSTLMGCLGNTPPPYYEVEGREILVSDIGMLATPKEKLLIALYENYPTAFVWNLFFKLKRIIF